MIPSDIGRSCVHLKCTNKPNSQMKQSHNTRACAKIGLLKKACGVALKANSLLKKRNNLLEILYTHLKLLTWYWPKFSGSTLVFFSILEILVLQASCNSVFGIITELSWLSAWEKFSSPKLCIENNWSSQFSSSITQIWSKTLVLQIDEKQYFHSW